MDSRLLLLAALLRGSLKPSQVASAIGSAKDCDPLLDQLTAEQREGLERELTGPGDSVATQAQALLQALRDKSLASEEILARLPSSWLADEAEMTVNRPVLNPDATIDREPPDSDGTLDPPIADVEMTIDPVQQRRVLLEPTDRHQDPYSITGFLAEGGLGKVYVAQDTQLDREVVLKQLQPTEGENDDSLNRFMREAQVTGQLEHPNIVPIYGLGWDQDDRPYYTMKYVRGQTLGDLIDDYHRKKPEGTAGRLQLRELLEAFLSVCNAVGYSHGRNVVHQDLKPDNIAMGEFGEVIVLDWGLAKLLDETQQESAGPTESILPDAGQVMGTPNYMPPEQARGDLDSVDARADIYSLGAILFYIVAGRPPRHPDPENLEQLVSQVAAGQIPALRQLAPNAPRQIDAICTHAMQHDPDHRYQEVAALSDDLRKWLADEPVSVYREPWTSTAARWARSHRTMVTTAGSMVLLALVTFTVLTATLNIERAKRLRARNDARRSQVYAEQARTLAEFSEQVAQQQRDVAHQVSLESRRQLVRQQVTSGMTLAQQRRPFEALLWFTRAYEMDKQLQADISAPQQVSLEDHQLRIHSVLARCPLPVQIWQLSRGAGQIRFSPTTNHLVTCNGHPSAPSTGPGHARVWQLNGVPLSPPLVHDESVNQLVFHHQGKLMATAAGGPTGTGSARAWQIPSGNPAGPVIRHTAPIVKVAIHPDGRLLATAAADGSARLWEIASGQPVSPQLEHDDPLSDIAFSPDGSRLVTAAGHHLQLWETETGSAIGKKISHAAPVRMCRFSIDGQTVFSATETGFFYRIDGETLASSRPWRTGNTRHRLSLLRVSPRDAVTLAAGRDGDLLVSRRASSRLSLGWTSTQAISDGRFNRQGDRLVVSSYSGETALISAKDGQLLAPPLLHPAAVLSTDIDGTNRFIATACRDGNVRIWDTALGERGQEDFSQPFNLINAAYSGDGLQLITATPEHNAIVWRRDPPIVPAFSLDHQAPIGLVVYGPGNNRIVTATTAGTVHLWNATSGDSISGLTTADMRTTKVIFRPDGGQLATLTTDRTIHIWNAADGHQLQQFGPLPGPVTAFAFHPTDSLLFTASLANTEPVISLVQAWGIQPGKTVGNPLRVKGIIRSMTMHPDGHRVLLHVRDAAGNGSHAQFWDIEKGNPVGDPFVHRDPVGGAELNTSGSLLLTSGTDGTVRLWDTTTGKTMGSPFRHTTPIRDMQFSHHGRFFATATTAGTVQLWSSTSGFPLMIPIDVGPSLVGIRFHPSDQELMILAGRTIRFIKLSGKAISPEAAALVVSAFSGHRLDMQGLPTPLGPQESSMALQQVSTSYPDLSSTPQRLLFVWNQRHGAHVPASFWESRLELITGLLEETSQAYVQYYLYMQRARVHVELEDYQAALADLQSSHRRARPDFSRGSYSLPLFQRACLAAFLGHNDIYKETYNEMIDSLDPLNPYDAPRTATANCLSPSGHGNLDLSLQLASRSVAGNPANLQSYLGFGLALHRSGNNSSSRTLVTRLLSRRPGNTHLLTALRLVRILAMIADGERDQAAAQMELSRVRIADLPALTSGRLGNNWHERLIVELLAAEVEQKLQTPPDAP